MISTSSATTWQIAEQARQDERRRIARDLHDDVVHQLTFLMLDVDLLRQQTGACHPDLMRERLGVVLERVKAIGSTVRDVAHQLKAPAPADAHVSPLFGGCA